MCLWAQLPDLRKEKGPASPQSSPLNQEPSLQATGDIDQGSQQSGHRALESDHALPCCVILAKARDPPGPWFPSLWNRVKLLGMEGCPHAQRLAQSWCLPTLEPVDAPTLSLPFHPVQDLVIQITCPSQPPKALSLSQQHHLHSRKTAKYRCSDRTSWIHTVRLKIQGHVPPTFFLLE